MTDRVLKHDKNSGILIVDDHAGVRDFFKLALEAGGWEPVYTAKDGYECLKILSDNIPQLIILDHKMPGMDGTAVIRALLEHEEFDKIPIVLVTSEEIRLEPLEEARLSGKYLKPLDIEEIQGIAATMLGSSTGQSY